MTTILAMVILAALLALPPMAVSLWTELAPSLGDWSLTVLVGLVSGANLLSVFGVSWLLGSNIGGLFAQVFGKWIVTLTDQVRDLDHLQNSVKKAIEMVDLRLANTDRIYQQLDERLEAAFRPLADTVAKQLNQKVEAITQQFEEELASARRVWFATLPFVEELNSLPPSERGKALELWFSGLCGNQDSWRQLAEYFRKRSRK
ncbi:MAG: hypothetical protein [aquatic viral metagenome]